MDRAHAVVAARRRKGERPRGGGLLGGSQFVECKRARRRCQLPRALAAPPGLLLAGALIDGVLADRRRVERPRAGPSPLPPPLLRRRALPTRDMWRAHDESDRSCCRKRPVHRGAADGDRTACAALILRSGLALSRTATRDVARPFPGPHPAESSSSNGSCWPVERKAPPAAGAAPSQGPTPVEDPRHQRGVCPLSTTVRCVGRIG